MDDLLGSSAVFDLSYSPDGKLLAAGTRWALRIWDTGTWEERHVLKHPAEYVRGVTFSPDGQSVVSGTANALKV